MYPLKDAPLRRSTLRVLDELQATERLPPEALDRLQAERVRRIVRHAATCVPYYRELFRRERLRPEDVRRADDLQRLPVLTKAIARERAAELAADVRPKGYVQMLYTSGSTGEPIAVAGDAVELSYHLANHLRGKRWHGVEIGDRELRVWHDPRAYVRGTLRSRAFWTANALKDRLLNVHTVAATDLSERELDEWARILRRVRPRVIYGYAASIYFFAQYLRGQGVDTPHVPTVIVTAEKIQPHQKRVVAEVFGARVVEEYGSTEIGVMAFECEEGRLHVCDESVVLEIAGVGDDGTGEVLVTSLTNASMPLIRYRIGDVAAPAEGSCACGRGLGLLGHVVGRTTDYLVDARGNAIHPFRVMHSLQRLDGLARYRVIQPALGQVELLAETTRPLASDELERVARVLRDALGDGTDVTVRCVDVLPPGARGKHRFLESAVSDAARGRRR